MKVLKDEKRINNLLEKGVDEIFPSKEELKKLLLTGKRLKVYQGFDPTGPSLHIGHAVAMRKLEDFRALGHEVIFLIGDFTAMIGDPSDKTAARKKLSKEEILENLKNYKKQASKIIDIDNEENPIKVLFNSQWLSKLTCEEIIELSSYFTVQQMIKRDMFQKRLEDKKPIYLNEFLYPLMQGYDSVSMEVDVEVCGHDQIFNALAGRHLSQELLKKNKFVLAGKMFTAEEGKKMGKTEGNMIELDAKPNDIFGKIMSFPDEKIVEGFELLTSKTLDEVENYEKLLKKPDTNPMDVKKELAFTITKELSSQQEAEKAKKYFEDVFQKKDLKTDLEEFKTQEGKINILTLLNQTNISQSKGEARRLIKQNAVSIDGEKIKDTNYMLKLEKSVVLRVGKKIIKITKE